MSLQMASRLALRRGTALTTVSDNGRSPGSRWRRRAMITLRRRRSGLAFAFRALAQELAARLFGAFLLRLDNQQRMVNQALAHGVARALVMLEPAAQPARGQRRLLEGLQKAFRMFGIGARQRRDHTPRRPARQPPRAHGLESRIG